MDPLLTPTVPQEQQEPNSEITVFESGYTHEKGYRMGVTEDVELTAIEEHAIDGQSGQNVFSGAEIAFLGPDETGARHVIRGSVTRLGLDGMVEGDIPEVMKALGTVVKMGATPLEAANFVSTIESNRFADYRHGNLAVSHEPATLSGISEFNSLGTKEKGHRIAVSGKSLEVRVVEAHAQDQGTGASAFIGVDLLFLNTQVRRYIDDASTRLRLEGMGEKDIPQILNTVGTFIRMGATPIEITMFLSEIEAKKSKKFLNERYNLDL